MVDQALQRKNMVESQVRPSNVTDRRITLAMARVRREQFVPDHLQALAYMDTAIAVAPDRSLMAPRDFAKLLQLADLSATDNVLMLGSLYGYGAAVAAHLGASITALDVDDSFKSQAMAAMTDHGLSNVTCVSGRLENGWKDRAPYNAIVVEGVLDSIPEALIAQLDNGGRLVAIMADAGVSRAVRCQLDGDQISKTFAFEASGSQLPGFELPRHAFAF